MASPESLIEELFQQAEKYSQTTLEWLKLTILDTSVDLLISLFSSIVSWIFLGVSFFILSFGVALYLGDFFVKSYYGFFIVAGFYFIVGLMCLFYLQRLVKTPLSELLIKKVLQ